MNTTHQARPLPAPLPFRSAAARGDVPPQPRDLDHAEPDPRAPILREDELSFWITTGIIAAVVLFVIVLASLGGRPW